MSEHTPQVEQCDHMRCKHPHRLEYCEIEGQDPDETIFLVVEKLNEVMYDFTDMSGGTIRHDSDVNGSLFEREFNMLRGDTKTWVWPLSEMSVKVKHTQEKARGHQRYDVTTGWVVHQNDAPTDPFVTNIHS